MRWAGPERSWGGRGAVGWTEEWLEPNIMPRAPDGFTRHAAEDRSDDRPEPRPEPGCFRASPIAHFPMDLVVSNLAGNLAAVVELARAQSAHADVLELRLDACSQSSEADLRLAFARLTETQQAETQQAQKHPQRPVLVAVNGPEAFGTFAGTDDERIALLVRAEAAGAAWIDVTWTLARRHAAQRGANGRARRIVSRHVLDETPANLTATLAEMEREAAPGDRLKLVTHAQCAEDGLRVLRLARERAREAGPSEGPTARAASTPSERAIIAFASGAAGSFTRQLAPVFGSLATYAAPVGAGSPTAPGQIPADVLRASWPPEIGPETRILGVVGRPASASLSPRLHGAALRRARVNAVYTAFEPASFDTFLDLCHELGVHGLSVTMPFKTDAARRATSRDDAVVACGAANTLVRTDRGWHATNTDASAVRTCIGRALCGSDRTLSDITAVVVGTGGAARAALYGLRGARLVVAGRDAAKCAELARAFGATPHWIDELADVTHDVLVNTTPLGSNAYPGAMPVPAHALRPGSIVFDAVYRPRATPLMIAARAVGAHTIEGRAWFLEQALAQFRTFTDVDAPAEAMRIELDRLLDEDAQ